MRISERPSYLFAIAGFWYRHRHVTSITLRRVHIYDFTSTTYGFVVSCTQGTLGRFDSLHGVEIGYGVDELIDLLDLQVSVFVGNDLCNGERFVVQINPECGLCLLGELISR